ncbi:hypothetical protein NQ317_010917, partial [Molorchus minor]
MVFYANKYVYNRKQTAPLCSDANPTDLSVDLPIEEAYLNMDEAHEKTESSVPSYECADNQGESAYQGFGDIRLDAEDIASQAVIDETNRLYFFHLVRQMLKTRQEFPFEFNEYTIIPQNARSFQVLANHFASSTQRWWVYNQAQNVDIRTLNFNTFQLLVYGLFQKSVATWERVLVLFYFCTDLSIRALREKLLDCFIRLYNWTTCYISSKLSAWVERQGGWDAVLQHA